MNLNPCMKKFRYLVWLFPALLTNCERAPAFNVLGSYFPAWLFCLVAGIILTVIARVVLSKYNLGEVFTPPLLMYSCLTAFFTFTLWLVFFRS